MPVQLQVRTQVQANQSTQAFQDRLNNDLSKSQVDGKQKIADLRHYIQNKGDNAKIRVVNTTNDHDLAFQFKSFGYKSYRQDRTAGALTQLLIHAGVRPEMAEQVVDKVLKDGANYRTATKAMVSEILNDPAIQFATAAAPARTAPVQAAPIQQNVPAQNAPLAAAPNPQVINAPPPPAPGRPNANILAMIQGEFKSLLSFQSSKAKPESDLQFTAFRHKADVDAQFYILKDPTATIVIQNGFALLEDDLFEGEAKKPGNDQQPPFKFVLQQKVNHQAVGEPMLVSRQELLTHPAYENKTFLVLGVLTSNAVIPHEPVDLAKVVQLAPDGASNQAPNPAPLRAVNPPPVAMAQKPGFKVDSKATAKTLDQFLQTQGLYTGANLGQGGFGSVKPVGAVPGNDAQLVKYFERNKQLEPVPLSPVRQTNLLSEAYAAYLVTSRDPAWVPPKVVAPTHYLVGQPSRNKPQERELQLVPIQDLKKTIRANQQNGLGDLQCYGLIMNKAPGKEVAQQLASLSQQPNRRAMITQSGLTTLKSLSARGFVHRDIKPANLIFNGQELNFIDTGLLFKVRKTAADKDASLANPNLNILDREHIAQLPTSGSGTPAYMHPNLFQPNLGYIGTQADLHAFGLVTLEMEAPAVLRDMRSEVKKTSPNKWSGPMDVATFLKTLDTVIASPDSTPEVKASATDLRTNMANPQHLAHLGLQCLIKADTSIRDNSAARWADRQFADQQYAELLKHPALGVRNGVVV